MKRGTLIAFGLTAGTALLLYSQRRASASNVSHPSGSPEAVKREFDALIGSGTSSLSYAHPEQVNIEQLYTLAVSLDALGMSALATQARDTAVRLAASRAKIPGEVSSVPPQIARAREILAKLKRDAIAVTQDEVNEARGLVPLLRAGSYGYEADSIETLLELRDRILIGLPGPITPGTNP